jgi:CheY-like chemotaxis protein
MTLKVFYVDDEPDIREVAVMSLELDPEIEVRTASSGREALAQLDGLRWRPDVLLLDVMMPEMDGPTLLARIREQTALAEVPAIFITARAQVHELDRFRAAGAAGVIHKPFDPMTLPDALRSVLAAGRQADERG